MNQIKITPVFAAFSFDTLDHARAAWRRLNMDSEVRNISAWTTRAPNFTPVVVLMGENKHRFVDPAAHTVMTSDGCQGNFILPPPMKKFFLARRYDMLAADLARRLGQGDTIEKIERDGGLEYREQQAMSVGIPIGILLGALIWYAVVRPMQLNNHERRRRDAGLPRNRELPEDTP